MKRKLFPLKRNSVFKSSTIKQLLINAAEEAGAWLLIGGFFLVVLWIIAIIFTETKSLQAYP